MSSLKKTHTCQTEANDKVWDLNWALETLAILYVRFEQVNSDPAKVVKEFDRKFAQRQDEMEKVQEAQFMRVAMSNHRLASDFDEAEVTRNEGLGCIHKLIAEMTTARSAVSIGTGDRGQNEQEYLKNALALLNRLLDEKDVAVGRS